MTSYSTISSFAVSSTSTAVVGPPTRDLSSAACSAVRARLARSLLRSLLRIPRLPLTPILRWLYVQLAGSLQDQGRERISGGRSLKVLPLHLFLLRFTSFSPPSSIRRLACFFPCGFFACSLIARILARIPGQLQPWWFVRPHLQERGRAGGQQCPFAHRFHKAHNECGVGLLWRSSVSVCLTPQIGQGGGGTWKGCLDGH